MKIPSQGLMKCRACLIHKPLNEMAATALAGARWPRCKDCENVYQRAHRKRNPESYTAYHRAWRAKNKDKVAEQSRARRAKLDPAGLEAVRKRDADKARRLNAKWRDEAYTAYGGYVCKCCGETEPMFLSIDHVENDGNVKRKEHGHGVDFYRWLRNNKHPSGFQVLCMNCNTGKHRNGGVCPHQTRCNDYPEREYGQVAGSTAHP